MAAESVALAFPVLMLGMVLPRYFPLRRGPPARQAIRPPVPGVGLTTFDYVVLFSAPGFTRNWSFGSILLTFLSLILRDAFEMRPIPAAVLMVLTSGVLFSAYHYLSPDEPPFRLDTFVFRTLAGIYFGMLFLTRGFRHNRRQPCRLRHIRPNATSHSL